MNDSGFQTASDVSSAVSGKANNSSLTSHTNNTTVHITSTERNTWNAKSDFSGSYNDLSNKPSIPSKVSELTNDSGFQTATDITNAISGKANSSDLTSHTGNTTVHITAAERTTWNAKQAAITSSNKLSYSLLSGTPTIPSKVSELTNDSGFQTAANVTTAISGKADTSALTSHTGNTTIHITSAERTAWNAKSDFSGSYTDLTNKPSIPSKVSELTNDSGYQTAANVSTAISGKADNSTLTSHTGNTTVHITSAERTAWNAVSNKANSSDLTSHTGNTTVHITATERSTWNAKQNAITSSNKLSYSLLSDTPSIPSKVSELTNDSGYITTSALSPYKTILTPYTTLTGTSVTVQPGKEYKWTLTGNSTLNISGGESGKVGECRIEITNNGTYTLTGGTGVSIRSTLQTNAVNYFTVRFMGTTARAYIFDIDEI